MVGVDSEGADAQRHLLALSGPTQEPEPVAASLLGGSVSRRGRGRVEAQSGPVEDLYLYLEVGDAMALAKFLEKVGKAMTSLASARGA